MKSPSQDSRPHRAVFDRLLFAELLDSIDEAFIAFDARGAVVSKNLAFQLLGGDHDELEREGRELAVSHSRSTMAESGIGRDFDTRCGGYRLRITHAGPQSDTSRLILVAYDRVVQTGGRRSLAASHRLTPREFQVAELVAEGRTNRDVASALGISAHTVRHHVARLLGKLGLVRRGEVAARFWREHTQRSPHRG